MKIKRIVISLLLFLSITIGSLLATNKVYAGNDDPVKLATITFNDYQTEEEIVAVIYDDMGLGVGLQNIFDDYLFNIKGLPDVGIEHSIGMSESFKITLEDGVNASFSVSRRFDGIFMKDIDSFNRDNYYNDPFTFQWSPDHRAFFVFDESMTKVYEHYFSKQIVNPMDYYILEFEFNNINPTEPPLGVDVDPDLNIETWQEDGIYKTLEIELKHPYRYEFILETFIEDNQELLLFLIEGVHDEWYSAGFGDTKIIAEPKIVGSSPKFEFKIFQKSGWPIQSWKERITVELDNNTVINFKYQFKYDHVVVEELEELPQTYKSQLGEVTFDVEGQTLLVDIFYDNSHYLFERTFVEETDMEIFDTIEAYYLNTDAKPQIIINHSDRPYLGDILAAPDGDQPAFVPHTIWDLDTNETKTLNSYTTYVYIAQNDKGVVIAYTYIDEFVIQEMLSAELRWTERTKISPPMSWILGKGTEWETKEAVLYNDRYLEYKDYSSTWMDYVPIWTNIRGVKREREIFEMPEIQNVDFNDLDKDFNVKGKAISKAAIEGYFREMDPSFTSIKNNYDYKLWAFALQEGISGFGGAQTEIYDNRENPDDPHNFHIINIVYETNGKIYEAIGDDMNLLKKLQGELDGENKPEPKGVNWNKILLVIISIVYILALYQTKAWKNGKNFITTTIIFAIVLVIVYFLLNSDIELLSVVLRL